MLGWRTPERPEDCAIMHVIWLYLARAQPKIMAADDRDISYNRIGSFHARIVVYAPILLQASALEPDFTGPSSPLSPF
jgi:hypothetical protein